MVPDLRPRPLYAPFPPCLCSDGCLVLLRKAISDDMEHHAHPGSRIEGASFPTSSPRSLFGPGAF